VAVVAERCKEKFFDFFGASWNVELIACDDVINLLVVLFIAISDDSNRRTNEA
jgi:hypothetical protein